PVPAPRRSDERLRQRYLSCFCCPPTIARTLARLPELCWSATADGVLVHQFAAGSVRLDTPSGRLGIEQRTDYPREGRVTLVVTDAPDGEVSIGVRIPGWAAGAALTVAGEDSPAEPGTYALVSRRWRVGDTVELDLPMRVRRLAAHHLVEEATNQMALQRGPVVYCLEHHDLDGGARPAEILLPRRAEFAERRMD